MTRALSDPDLSEVQGDPTSFQELTDRFRRELFVHCYRMLGGVEDAEDALQETLLKAWRHIDALKEQTALRAWLYRIATNVCLDALARNRVRLMPPLTHPPADAGAAVGSPVADPVWLDPLPETYLDAYFSSPSPERQVELQEHVSLAFLVALQQLPGRQRAVLLLCDVLEWKAQEAADTLELSVAAVNSALQRARTALRKLDASADIAPAQMRDEGMTLLLQRYVQAWEAADTSALMSLLREDAALTMPPFAAWFRGRDTLCAFLDRFIFGNRLDVRMRLAATRANGCPAFAVYEQFDGYQKLVALHVLTIFEQQIAQIDDFVVLDQPIYRKFHLPLPPDR